MSPTIANAIFWIAAACCLIAQIALVVSAIRSPMRTADTATVPMPPRSREIAWTVVPAIGLAVLLVFTWRAMHPPVMTHDMPAGHRMIDE